MLPLVTACSPHRLKSNYGLKKTVIPSGDVSEVERSAIVFRCMTRRAKDHDERELGFFVFGFFSPDLGTKPRAKSLTTELNP